MNILITGGAGTLGSNILERLLEKPEVNLLCIDNFETGSRQNISFLPDSSIVEGSITDLSLMETLFEEFSPDIVIHSAASYKDPNDYLGDANTNILGSIIIGSLAQKYKVSKVIHFQTALCYGKPEVVPVPINHPIRPFTSYGLSKAQGESYLSHFSIPLVSLRLANICSKNLSIGPIPTFYKRIQEGKSCFYTDAKRDFLDFDDFFELLEIILFKSDQLGYFNVSTGEGKSIGEVFKAVRDHLNMNVEAEVRQINSDDVSEMVLDPSKTVETFGWSAKTGFEKTMQKQLSYYDTLGVDQIFSHLKK